MSMDHRCHFQAMGLTYRTQIGYLGTSGQEVANGEVSMHGAITVIYGAMTVMHGAIQLVEFRSFWKIPCADCSRLGL